MAMHTTHVGSVHHCSLLKAKKSGGAFERSAIAARIRVQMNRSSSMCWRAVEGMIYGATITSTIAVTTISALIACQILVVDMHNPLDAERDLLHFRRVLPIVALAGAAVGAIGGFAARLPAKGLSLLKSISIIGACAVVTRWATATGPRYIGSSEPSLLPVGIVILIAGALILGFGISRGRAEK